MTQDLIFVGTSVKGAQNALNMAKMTIPLLSITSSRHPPMKKMTKKNVMFLAINAIWMLFCAVFYSIMNAIYRIFLKSTLFI